MQPDADQDLHVSAIEEQDIFSIRKDMLESLSYHKLGELQKLCGQIRAKKYPRSSRKPKYGNLPRLFNNECIIAFFNEPVLCRNNRVRKKLLKLFFYGRRIGECNDIKIVPGQGLVQIVNHKSSIIEYKPLIEGTEVLFENDFDMNPHYLRKYFRETCQRLGPTFCFQYGLDTRGRHLHQFSVHCFRKTAGNMLRVHTGDPYKVAVFLGHDTESAFGPTSFYMHYDIEDMRKDLNACFRKLVEDLL